ncbi:MAG: acyl-CoA thioesterase II [Myxococcota bacterium]
MPQALDALVSLLDLEELEVNIFRGRSPEEGSQRVFGGQVLGQALVAAGRTVDQRSAHSFHAYFLRPGDPSTPILYQVDRTRDGRSFTTRRAIAIQHGRAIFHLEASFQRAEKGPEHQEEMPEAPDPEGLPTWRERLEPLAKKAPKEMGRWIRRPRPIDIRYVTQVDPVAPEKLPARLLVWLRADGRLADEPSLHQCVVAYASDMTLLDTAVLPHAISWMDRSHQVASLDHAMWFHREFRADEWLLYAQESPAAGGARGFSMGRIYTRDGKLVVSVVQEGLIRPLQGS